MSIQGKINELQSINKELLTLRNRVRNLNTHKKKVEEYINNYLESKKQPGLKYKDLVVVKENTIKRKNKKKSERQNDAVKVLEKYGIQNPTNVLNEVLEARRGEKFETSKIIMTKK